jgi:hypothetical protein
LLAKKKKMLEGLGLAKTENVGLSFTPEELLIIIAKNNEELLKIIKNKK